MGKYRFLSSAAIAQPTAKDIAKAETISSLADIVMANRVQGEYQFAEEKGLAPLFGKILTAEITIETLNNGSMVNRLIAVTEKAGKQRFRCFGKGRENVINAHALTADEIGKLTFGFCTSDGERLTENRVDATTGEVKKSPVLYANVAAL